jgi:hypothetical protein
MTAIDFLAQHGFRPADEIGITLTEATDTAVYRIKGTTEDITTCDRCGRTDLKRTVIVATLDADGTEVDAFNAGTDCAATLAKLTEHEVRAAADTADRREADRRRRDLEDKFRAWMLAEHGATIPIYVRPADVRKPVGPFPNLIHARMVWSGQIA